MKKRKIRRTMGVFFTTFLLLQIILLFLYKAFIVDIAKKNEENLVENTLQIYHNTMEGVLDPNEYDNSFLSCYDEGRHYTPYHIFYGKFP